MCAAALWLHCSARSHCDISTRELLNPFQPDLPPKPVFIEAESETPLQRYQRHADSFPKPLCDVFESVLYSDYPEDTVDVTDAKLSDEDLKQLLHLLRHYNKVSTVMLTGNQLSAERVRELMTALEAQETVEDLDLADCGLDEEGVQALCETLPRLTGLRQLRISRNHLPPSALANIFRALKGSKLTCLWVSHNTMGPDASQALSELLATTKLEILALSHAKITAECVAPLAESLRKCRTLKHLLVNNNPLYSEGVRLLCLNLPWSLQLFDVSEVGMGTEAARALSLGIASVHNLHTLRLDRNSIEDEGLQFLTSSLIKHEGLRHFSAAMNDFSFHGGHVLISLLLHIKELRTLRLAGNRLGEIGRGIRDYILRIRHLDLRQCRMYCQLDLKRELKFALLDLKTDVDF